MKSVANLDSLPLEIRGEILNISADKIIFWSKRKYLFVADLHIGKVGHFRKNNIPIPNSVAEKNFIRLEKVLLRWKPKKVYFLGDLFHSVYNMEWERLCFLLAKYPKIEFILISGNHDILREDEYKKAGIKRLENLKLGPFWLSHHPEEHETLYNLCGHIHPGIRMRGNARQHMKIACFHLSTSQGILPAFGSFTGTAALKARPGDQIFAVVKDQIIKISTEKNIKD